MFLEDKNKIGTRFYSNSNINLGNISFRNENENIRTMAYLFHLNYEEDLPDKMSLLTRG